MRTTSHQPQERSPAGTSTALVVDDHQAVLRGVRDLLDHEPEIEVIGSAASFNEALAAARARPPDVAVVDFHLPDRDGLTLTRRLKALPDPPRVLIFSAYADQRLELAALVAGADRVLPKHALGVELCDQVKLLARGAKARLSVSPETLAAASRDLDLEDRPILGMLVNGTPPAEIAEVLGVDDEWLDIRRWAMLQRLKAPPRVRRAEAVNRAG
jgi:DNA-binding NarL/FixJ family response regulator